MKRISIGARKHWPGPRWNSWKQILPRRVSKLKQIIIEFQPIPESEYVWDIRKEDVSEAEKHLIGTIDRDQEDWFVKLGGPVFSLLDRSKDSILATGRYNPERKKWQYTSYANHNGQFRAGDDSGEVLFEANTSDTIKVIIDRIGRDLFEYKFFVNGSQIITEVRTYHVTRKAFRYYFESWLWLGGANNAPGPYGGTHYTRLDFNWSVKYN